MYLFSCPEATAVDILLYFFPGFNQRLHMCFLHDYIWLFSLTIITGIYHILTILQSKVNFNVFIISLQVTV